MPWLDKTHSCSPPYEELKGTVEDGWEGYWLCSDCGDQYQVWYGGSRGGRWTIDGVTTPAWSWQRVSK